MIAAAMNTRPEEALPYRDLAKQRARISRSIELEQLPRLEKAVSASTGADGGPAGVSGPFDVELSFRVDEADRVRIEGSLRGPLELDCHGCAESRTHVLELEFGCFVADSDARADELTALGDVVLASGVTVTVADVVEDEILLNLPERLCTAVPCDRAPRLHYPAESDDGENADAGAERAAAENPFAVLSELKKR